MRVTVLIVEDETAIADTIQYAPETEGFTPILAATGQEALERFAACAVDLIILDIGLPDTSGFELCGNSGDTLLIFDLWAWLFGFELSIQQPFQFFNEGIIAYWPAGSLVFPEQCHIRFPGING